MAAEPLQATSADGTELVGERERAGPVWLVLAHDVGRDLDDWRPLRAALRSSGWSTLALDLRGHGGSQGEWTPAGGALDVTRSVELAREDGAAHVTVVAAGRAAIAALEADADARRGGAARADALVLLSPGPVGEIAPARLRGDGLPTLILYGAAAPAAGDDAARLLRLSIGWTVAVSFGTDVQGTALLQGPYAAHVADRLGAFVREQAVLRSA